MSWRFALILISSLAALACGRTHPESPGGDGSDNDNNPGSTGPVCGNGTVETGEECDLGAGNGPTTACTSDCHTPTASVCGDGILGAAEQCDDGNQMNMDGCSESCRLE